MGWWNWPGWPLPEEWAAFWAFATFLVAAVAAAVALGQFSSYRRELEERARPYLVVDIDFRTVLMYVAVENVSQSLATNVSMVSKPMLRGSTPKRDEVLSEVLGGTFVIPQMAPGRKMQWLVDRAPDLLNDPGKPHRVVITVTYTDPRKHGITYSDEFVVDLDPYRGASMTQDYDNLNWNIAERNERRLGSIQDSLATLSSAVSEAVERTGRRGPLMKGNRRSRR